jgi:hypothetical protein
VTHDNVIKVICSSAGCGFIWVVKFSKALKFTSLRTHFLLLVQLGHSSFPHPL